MRVFHVCTGFVKATRRRAEGRRRNLKLPLDVNKLSRIGQCVHRFGYRESTLAGDRRLLSIRAMPDDAVFQAVVVLVSNEIDSEIVRVDRYGELSKCVAHKRKLRPYCYCVK